jgi:hypothetical protein
LGKTSGALGFGLCAIGTVDVAAKTRAVSANATQRFATIFVPLCKLRPRVPASPDFILRPDLKAGPAGTQVQAGGTGKSEKLNATSSAKFHGSAGADRRDFVVVLRKDYAPSKNLQRNRFQSEAFVVRRSNRRSNFLGGA